MMEVVVCLLFGFASFLGFRHFIRVIIQKSEKSSSPKTGDLRVVRYKNGKYYIEMYHSVYGNWERCWATRDCQHITRNKDFTTFNEYETAVEVIKKYKKYQETKMNANIRDEVVWSEDKPMVNQIAQKVGELSDEDRHEILKQLINADKSGDDNLAKEKLKQLGEI